MIEYLNKLFKNDWLIIETFSGDFGSKFTYNGRPYTEMIIETSYYYIQYSKIRNKVRIKKENSNYITKDAYQDALNYANAINRELLLGETIENILSKI